jgi:hypothetical protein
VLLAMLSPSLALVVIVTVAAGVLRLLNPFRSV